MIGGAASFETTGRSRTAGRDEVFKDRESERRGGPA